MDYLRISLNKEEWQFLVEYMRERRKQHNKLLRINKKRGQSTDQKSNKFKNNMKEDRIWKINNKMCNKKKSKRSKTKIISILIKLLNFRKNKQENK